MRGRNRPIGAVAVLVVAALAVALGSTAPAAADPKFPSWAEVQKARKNVKTKDAEIAKISKLVTGLQGRAAAAGKVALVRGEEYLDAKQKLASAKTAATKLTAQSDAAAERAHASARRAGELAAQLARQGGGDITLDLLLSGKKSADLLDVLGTASKLTESTTDVFTTAETDQRTAAALSSQAVLAQKLRAARAKTASSALAAAKRASDSAQAKVAAVGSQQKVLTAQLATLKGVSKKTEAGYVAGVAWEKKQAAQTTPPPNGPPTGTTPGAPNGSAVSGAISFAEAQLGKPYRLDGSGPTYWDCSGLTKSAYASVGVYIGTHSATDQYNTMHSEGKLVTLSDRQAGDLLWYSDGGSTSAVKYHVTLYIGNGEMIEAPYPGAVVRIAAIRFGDLVPYAGRPTG